MSSPNRPLAPLLWGLGPTLLVAVFVAVTAVANGEPWLAAPAAVALLGGLLYVFGPTLARPLRRAWRWCFPAWHLLALALLGCGSSPQHIDTSSGTGASPSSSSSSGVLCGINEDCVGACAADAVPECLRTGVCFCYLRCVPGTIDVCAGPDGGVGQQTCIVDDAGAHFGPCAPASGTGLAITAMGACAGAAAGSRCCRPEPSTCPGVCDGNGICQPLPADAMTCANPACESSLGANPVCAEFCPQDCPVTACATTADCAGWGAACCPPTIGFRRCEQGTCGCYGSPPPCPTCVASCATDADCTGCWPVMHCIAGKCA